MATAAEIRLWRRIFRDTTAAALLSLFLLAGAAWAQSTNLIYQDTFNRTAPLNGSTPSLAKAGHGNGSWIGYPGLTTDGAGISVTVATPPAAGGMSQYNNAFLPFTPEAGHVYTLSVDIDPPIAYVGVGADGATGYFRHLSLSDCVPAGFTNRGLSEYRNVASGSEPGVQIAVSSHSFLNGGMLGDKSTCPLNRPPAPGDPAAHVWISSEYEHLPQWVWIHFPGPRRIDKVVIRAASKQTRPVEISGQYLPSGSDQFVTLFHTAEAQYDAGTLACSVSFEPVVASNFRLLIERSAPSVTPQSWVAELSQIQVFGVNATNPVATSVLVSSNSAPADLGSGLQPTGFVPRVIDRGPTLDIQTPWYRLVLAKSSPRILRLCWDSLGQGELGVNFLQDSGACPVLDPVFEKSLPLGAGALTRTGNVFRYAPVAVASNAWEQVCIRAEERGFDLGLAAAADQTMLLRGGLFRFHFAANQTPTTFVCRPSRIMNFVEAPAYLAAPDFGSAYITRTGDPAAFYRKPSALFPASKYWVDITPGEPVAEDGLNEIGPKPWLTTLHFEVEQIEPLALLVKEDSRLKRFPKYSLNMVQWRPDTGILGNSVMSIDCPLSLLFYAEEALFAPQLKGGISPMAMVGASVDRYFQGSPGYQAPNRNVCAPDWSSSRETAAYLIISAWYVIRTIGGNGQLHEWLESMECLANHLEAQFGPDGLIHHRDRGSMWFDTYNMQGADAYCNAADYRAFECLADLETLAGRRDLAGRYRADANRLGTAFFKSFYNPETKVLAGWRSEDGKLHDFMFPWVNGFAICQGLVPPAQAKDILQVLLAKLETDGFHSYPLGLPTNLTPMSPADYIPNTSGAPTRSDGTDTWQIYMNGGATPALEYYFIQALYRTGQYEQAERLLWPLMGSYEKGTFNAGIQLPQEQQRNPVGSAFYQ